MDEPLRVAALLCARLCHDLSGPLGALIGVIDIAREEQPASETIAFAEETVGELTQRLRLLRAAWGYDGEDLDVARLRILTDGLSQSRRVRVDLSGLQPDSVFPQPAARVMLNLVLLAAESLPGGGTAALSGSPASGVVVTIAGPRAAWPEGLGLSLTDDAAACEALLADPRRLQAPLTVLLARRAGLRLSVLMPPAGRVGEADAAPPLLLSP